MRHEIVEDIVPYRLIDDSYKISNKKSYKVVTPVEWKQRYIAYMLKEGLSEEDAKYYYDGIEFGTYAAVYDCSDVPEEAAEEDLTYG